jgi:hypothetical protein
MLHPRHEAPVTPESDPGAGHPVAGVRLRWFWAAVLVCFVGGVGASFLFLGRDAAWAMHRSAIPVAGVPAAVITVAFLLSIALSGQGRFRLARLVGRGAALLSLGPGIALALGYPYPGFLAGGFFAFGLVAGFVILPMWENHVRVLRGLLDVDPGELDPETRRIVERFRVPQAP